MSSKDRLDFRPEQELNSEQAEKSSIYTAHRVPQRSLYMNKKKEDYAEKRKRSNEPMIKKPTKILKPST